MMNNPLFYAISGAGLLALPISVPAKDEVRKPNVVMFLTDDQGAIDINRFGSRDLCTPVLDALCDSGVMMTRFYANSSISSPSRSAIMTGHTPQRAQVPQLVPYDTLAAGLPPSEVTIAEVLRDNGYSTALIGKWHLGMNCESHPNNQGFDYFFGHLGGCIDNYSHYFYWNGPNVHDLWRNHDEVWYAGNNFSDMMVSESCSYIKENKDRPFFLCFSSNYPHYPLQGDTEWREYYDGIPSPRDKYAAMVSTVDKKIGMVIDCLENEGLRDNTIIIFMSDNGFSTEIRTFGGGGSAGNLRGSKFSSYEGGIRVPAIISYHGVIPEGRICDQVGAGYDWFPTILDFCGIPSGLDFDGASLKDVICNGADSPHDVLNWEMPNAWAVRKGDYKLVGIVKEKKERLELYNLKDDEGERTDLSAEMPEKVGELLACRRQWKESVNRHIDSKSVCVKDLCDNWTFSRADRSDWMPANVPGTVHTDLYAAGIIDEPFYGDNEKDLQWIDKYDWIYRSEFDLDSKEFAKKNIDLCLEGLDTYADVYVNGKRVISADNMFLRYSVDVKQFLKLTGNELKILFRSPVREDLRKYDSLPYHLYSSADDSRTGGLGDKKISVFARKVQSQYGWDWGPRFVTSGIWKPVSLRMWDDVYIKDVCYRQERIAKDCAELTAKVEVISEKTMDVDLFLYSSGKKVFGHKAHLKKGNNLVEVPFRILSPELWWPNGMGAQKLYDLDLRLEAQDSKIDCIKTKIGLRTVRLVQEPDKWGTSFAFEVNGVRMFAKGANLIPTNSFVPDTGKKDIMNIVRSAADAGMNMLRVWGGGYYQDGRFYDLCDSLGILVWQDFAFACKMYPTDDRFYRSVKEEAIDNVRRLRNHASLAMWCGNNEMTQAWYNWGWGKNKKIPQKYRDEMWKGYSRIFFEMLPEVIKEYDSGRFYWPSSPSSSFDEPQNYTSGDVHYWKYRDGKLPVSVFREEMGRFMSEYGFQSSPLMKTLYRYLDEDEMDFSSSEYRTHVKSRFEPELTLHYVNEMYGGKPDFKSGVYLGQIHQAEALKYVISQHRLNQPFCMGSLYWQLNDCWPGASWSTIDYTGEWKPAHYRVKEAFAGDIVAADIVGDSILVYGITERMKPIEAVLSEELMSFDGELLNVSHSNVRLEPNASTLLDEGSIRHILGQYDAKDVFLRLTLHYPDGERITDNVIFAAPKDLDLHRGHISVMTRYDGINTTLVLETDTYTKYVWVDVPGDGVSMSDNYFDLLPNCPKTITIEGHYKPSDIRLSDYLDYRK